MFSPIVSQPLGSFQEVERLKKDTFDSHHVMVSNDDHNEYLWFLSSRRWWLEFKSWTGEGLNFFFYTHWKVPVYFLRFANELFVEQEDLTEVQVVWDRSINRYYMKKSGCKDVTDDNQMPIVRLFKSYPKKEPNGIWGVCKRPLILDNPYDYYGVSLYSKLGHVIEELSSSAVFQ